MSTQEIILVLKFHQKVAASREVEPVHEQLRLSAWLHTGRSRVMVVILPPIIVMHEF